MTPGEAILYARQQYNAVNDAFFSDSELYTHLWMAQNILATEAKVIENTYTTPTVVDQQEYSYPDQAIAIKRITWDGKRLDPISFKDDDSLTGFLSNTTATGRPLGYVLFDRIIYLRPVPNAVYTLKIYTFDQPQQVSATSVLDVPEVHQLSLVDFLLWRMASKDQNFQSAQYYKEQWEAAVAKAKQWSRKRLIADGFKVVRDESQDFDVWERL